MGYFMRGLLVKLFKLINVVVNQLTTSGSWHSGLSESLNQLRRD